MSVRVRSAVNYALSPAQVQGTRFIAYLCDTNGVNAGLDYGRRRPQKWQLTTSTGSTCVMFAQVT